MSSLERADCSDAVQSITFMHSYPLRNGNLLASLLSVFLSATFSCIVECSPMLTIWLGTSMGSVICVALKQYQSPSSSTSQVQSASGNSRRKSYSPSNLGLICSTKGSLISICFLDSSGTLLKPPDETNSNPDRRVAKNVSQNGSNVNLMTQSTTDKDDASSGDKQFLVLASDKEAKVCSYFRFTNIH